MKQPLYRILSTFIYDYEICEVRGNPRAEMFRAQIAEFVRKYMPQDPEISKPYKLLLGQSTADCPRFAVQIKGRNHQFVLKPSLRKPFRLLAVGSKLPERHYQALCQALLVWREEVLV